jgi:hypothetical protein
LQPRLNALSVFAVDFRYPGKSAVKSDAQQAIKDCRAVRQVIRAAFGLPL